jgi:23S rRNA (cytidine1920-2'-O)/16S rRNA (cytidine1409-2'-O)-methyltransferase
VRRRVDTLVMEKGLAESRERARALVMAGKVLVDGEAMIKPGAMVGEGVMVEVLEGLPFVSRGGLKLDHALDQFDMDVRGRTALDIGASAGGFTDCLLKRGVERVYAVDVGYGQLDWRLRSDPRVVVMERVNARHLISLDEQVDIATIDVSFISVEKILPNMPSLVKKGRCVVVLFKPQFEVAKGQVGKGGIVKDPLLHARSLGRFIVWAVEHDFRIRGLIPSPILGAEGNKEFLLLLGLS